MRNLLIPMALLGAVVFLSGCDASAGGSYTVSSDQDSFTETVNGRTVSFENWTISVDGKQIPIAQERSVIRIENDGDKVDIFVNGEQVHDE
jgi:outer membrane lipopolysaccharide assembly protein LptE/RlpB